jgi:hypothetical protein
MRIHARNLLAVALVSAMLLLSGCKTTAAAGMHLDDTSEAMLLRPNERLT